MCEVFPLVSVMIPGWFDGSGPGLIAVRGIVLGGGEGRLPQNAMPGAHRKLPLLLFQQCSVKHSVYTQHLCSSARRLSNNAARGLRVLMYEFSLVLQYICMYVNCCILKLGGCRLWAVNKSCRRGGYRFLTAIFDRPSLGRVCCWLPAQIYDAKKVAC